MTTAFEALCAVSKTKPKAGEEFEDFARRLTDKVNTLPDKDWNSLGDDSEAQKWHNACMTAFDKRRAAKSEARKKGEDEDEAWASIELPELEGYEPVAGKAEKEDAPAEEEADAEPAEETVDESTGEVTTKPKAKTKTKPKVAAKEKAPAKAKKEPKAKAAKGKRGRAALYPEDAKIKLLVTENPHRPKTGRHARWKHYKDGMTVAEAYKKGLQPVNLRYSVLDGHIKIA